MPASEFSPDFVNQLTARRVYSEPVTSDGMTLITAAAVQGGAGMRQDHGDDGGRRGGMGIRARPVGAYVLRDGTVRWAPALDLSRIVLRAQLVVLTGLIVLGCLAWRPRAGRG